MTVEDIIHLARYSELKSLSAKDNTPAIIAFLNLAVIELYKIFSLKRVSLDIEINDSQVVYELPENYLYPANAFQIVKEGNEYKNKNIPINDDQCEESIFLPSYNTLQIPDTIKNDKITFIYVEKPKKYSIENLNEEVDVPDILVDCLIHYIGYKAHSGVKSDGQSENNAHYARFERSVFKVQNLGISTYKTQSSNIDKILQKGFV